MREGLVRVENLLRYMLWTNSYDESKIQGVMTFLVRAGNVLRLHKK